MRNIQNVVFFTDNFPPRNDKRITQFLEKGYDVVVYTFADKPQPKNYSIIRLGNYPNSVSYINRLYYFTRDIKREIKKFDKRTTLFYFFTLNTAIASLFFKKILFVYEESDMLFDRSRRETIRFLVRKLNLTIIKKSFVTVFTSQGFADYYYGKNVPSNIVIVPNKVDERLLSLPKVEKEKADLKHLRFAFVGNVRYVQLYNMAKVVSEKFKNYEFHFYGTTYPNMISTIEKINGKDNIFFHGAFKNPDDLPEIYSQIDFVVATYDTTTLNPQYAEPNKIYEAIFFRTPIIVSDNSYLANKVNSLNIGFDVDAMNEEQIIGKISSINEDSYNLYVNALNSIPQTDAVSDASGLFEMLEKIS